MPASRPREYQIYRFIAETLAPLVSARRPIDKAPLLGIDEGLNNEQHIGTMYRRLVSSGVVSGSEPLWSKLRQDENGRLLSVLGGSLSREAQEFVGRYGREVRGDSWPDERVLAQACANFTHVDKFCILTTNKKNDINGLRHIIMNEVRPALQALQPQRLGLLVLVMSPAADLRAYSQAVESRLCNGAINPGVTWEHVP